MTVEGPEAIGHAFFVVRSPQPGPCHHPARLSTDTYNAYNSGAATALHWCHGSFLCPHSTGSLNRPELEFDGRIASIKNRRAAASTFANLPGRTSISTLERLHRLAQLGRRFVRWAERNGYLLDYAINSDLEFHPEVLDGYRLMLQRRP